ncbi:MAG: conjugal transfer protein TraE [Ruminococcus sp.]|nr:conjugal transfer protein TraE [Ruminococcus sp.]
MKQAENKSKPKKSKTVPLTKEEYSSVKKRVAEKEKQQKRKIPKTAQQSIPFDYMTKDGIAVSTDRKFSLLAFITGKQKATETRYSKTVQFYDADYEIAEITKQQNIFAKYCSLLNSFDNSVKFQISVVNLTNDDDFEDIIQIPDHKDKFNDIRQEYAQMLRTQLAKGNNGFIRVSYITFSVVETELKKARRKLTGIEKDIVGIFKSFGVAAAPLNGEERLFAMYKMLHQYSKEPFICDFDKMAEGGFMPKDYIAPSSFDFRRKNDFGCGKFYGSTYSINLIASEMSDRFLTQLMSADNPIAFTMHFTAIDNLEAKKYVKMKLSNVERMKVDEQKKAAQQGYDMDILPPDMKTYLKELELLLDDLETKNERMFLVTFLVTNFSSSRKKLEVFNERLNRKVLQANCKLIPLDNMQDLGLASILPLAENRIEIERRLTTSSAAVFLPFSTKEIFMDGEAMYYGLNSISLNLIMGNRKNLTNPNGIVTGVPGSGKSFTVKREICNVFLVTDDDIVICDPEDEYYPLVQEFGGQVIELSTSSKDYINLMDIERNSKDDDVIGVKSEFILSLCEVIVSGKYGLDSEEISIIDRCVKKLYTDYFARMENASDEEFYANMPILGDLQKALYDTGEECAKRVANSLEIYVNGSLNIFNHRTNVDLKSRIVCFNVKRLKNNLRKLGMLIVQDQVWNKVSTNRGNKATWYYMDEFHLLLKEPQTAKYSVEMWKRFRKWGGIPTGITQNVKDFLASSEVEAIFENSDFVIMLKQASGDREILSERLKISPAQQQYITETPQGHGLIYFSGSILPFEDEFPRDTKLYKLMTTKPLESEI